MSDERLRMLVSYWRVGIIWSSIENIVFLIFGLKLAFDVNAWWWLFVIFILGTWVLEAHDLRKLKNAIEEELLK